MYQLHGDGEIPSFRPESNARFAGESNAYRAQVLAPESKQVLNRAANHQRNTLVEDKFRDEVSHFIGDTGVKLSEARGDSVHAAVRADRGEPSLES
jgi:hypothetical protein